MSDEMLGRVKRLKVDTGESISTRASGRKVSIPFESKVINDPIHSSIELHPAMVMVIDTPQFQRLRGLKQLGASSYVFPGASHSRFEHSIGVSHLASYVAKTLQEKQPELMITDRDILCVGLAGLCHDLGHGILSHLFDGEFLRGRKWAHEKGSVLMFRYLLEDNNIDLKELFGFSDSDLLFVEEMILGNKIEGGLSNRKGRDASKYFLYDIVNNERSGFDVDKIDYILRDSYYTGVKVSIGTNVDRIVHMARVLPDEKNVLTISFPEKAVHTLFGVFHARVWLHTVVYQHKVVKACELMIRDILVQADQHLRFRSKLTGKEFRMSESVEDMSVFCQLKDSVLDLIALSTNPALQPAQELLRRLEKRDIYRSCGHVDLPEKVESTSHKMQREQEIAKQILAISSEEGLNLTLDDFIVEVMVVHHGRGSSNPVDGLRFYSKPSGARTVISHTPRNSQMPMSPPTNSQSSTDSAFRQGKRCFKISQSKYASALVPQRMGASGVRIFAKTQSARESVTRCFKKWSRRVLMASPLCHNSQEEEEGEEDEGRLDDDKMNRSFETSSPISPVTNHRSTSGGSNGFVQPHIINQKKRERVRLSFLEDL